uniref:Uncharacterized protein n=1 Tax=Pristionchus pacificus TaxID=54126 RepID=A0A2A6CMZ2_PRIPA|eukprot:PDM79468.1 hypothetical protein PRIPAC_32047 [Pristionchus pacificus]
MRFLALLLAVLIVSCLFVDQTHGDGLNEAATAILIRIRIPTRIPNLTRDHHTSQTITVSRSRAPVAGQ